MRLELLPHKCFICKKKLYCIDTIGNKEYVFDKEYFCKECYYHKKTKKGLIK